MTEDNDGLFEKIIKIVKKYRPELTLHTWKDYPCCFEVEFRD